MLIFKTLHILSMFTAVTAFLGGEFFFAFAIWRRDVRALAASHRAAVQGRLGVVGTVAFFAGIGFGLLTAATGGLDFFQGWLINAYVLVALFLVNVALNVNKGLRLGEAAAEADAGRRPIEEVVRDMAASHMVRFFVVNVVIFAAFIADMVLKF